MALINQEVSKKKVHKKEKKNTKKSFEMNYFPNF